MYSIGRDLIWDAKTVPDYVERTNPIAIDLSMCTRCLHEICGFIIGGVLFTKGAVGLVLGFTPICTWIFLSWWWNCSFNCIWNVIVLRILTVLIKVVFYFDFFIGLPWCYLDGKYCFNAICFTCFIVVNYVTASLNICSNGLYMGSIFSFEIQYLCQAWYGYHGTYAP